MAERMGGGVPPEEVKKAGGQSEQGNLRALLSEAEPQLLEDLEKQGWSLEDDRTLRQIIGRKPALFSELGKKIGWEKVLEAIDWYISEDEDKKPILRTRPDSSLSVVVRRNSENKWIEEYYAESPIGAENRGRIRAIKEPLTQEILDEVFAK